MPAAHPEEFRRRAVLLIVDDGRRRRADRDNPADPCGVAGGLQRAADRCGAAASAAGQPRACARLMESSGLQGLTRRKRWRRTKLDTVAFVKDLVGRSFRPDGPLELRVADITQHPTREGWVYCAAVIDASSRLVVGHAIADHLRTELIIDASDVANWRRRPAPGTSFRSEHGSQ